MCRANCGVADCPLCWHTIGLERHADSSVRRHCCTKGSYCMMATSSTGTIGTLWKERVLFIQPPNTNTRARTACTQGVQKSCALGSFGAHPNSFATTSACCIGSTPGSSSSTAGTS
eukprot:2896567-Rhodomonas_salina.2